MKMLDYQGKELEIGNFVKLTEGRAPFINACMRKGNVYKIHSFRNCGSYNKPLIVCYLTGKKGGTYCYNSGFESYEIEKVDYDLKKRKVIKLNNT